MQHNGVVTGLPYCRQHWVSQSAIRLQFNICSQVEVGIYETKNTETALSSGCKWAKTVSLWIFFLLKTKKNLHLILSDLFVVAVAGSGNIYPCMGSVPGLLTGNSLSNIFCITLTNCSGYYSLKARHYLPL